MRVVILLPVLLIALSGCAVYEVGSTAVGAATTVAGTAIDAAGSVAGGVVHTVSGGDGKDKAR